MTIIDPATVATFGTDLGGNIMTGINDLWPVMLVTCSIVLAFIILTKIQELIMNTANEKVEIIRIKK